PLDNAECPNSTSTQMLVDAKAGRLACMVHLYAPWVLQLCRQGFPPRKGHPQLYPVPRQDEQDVVHNVWVKLFDKIKDFTKDGKPRAFRRWLYTRTRIGVLEYWADPKDKFYRSCTRLVPIDDVPGPAPPPGGSSRSPPTDSSVNPGPVPESGLPRPL